MKTKTYKREFGEIIVEEFARGEFVELAKEFVDNAEWCDSLGIELEETISIDYKDGTSYSYHDWVGHEGRFKVSGMKFGVISNPCTYQVFGAYRVDENGILERA